MKIETARALFFVFACAAVSACGDEEETNNSGTDTSDTAGGDTDMHDTVDHDADMHDVMEGTLPEACPATPSLQSPALFGEGGITPETAETCETAGTEWIPCHQHMHCGPEHTGAGICASAECEVHTVHRMRKDGAAAAPVESLHEGTVGGNCEPADHDLMVVATFLSFEEGCEAGDHTALTYCGSATGNNTLDTDSDGAVTCVEAGVNPTSVRWCIKAECECHEGSTAEDEVEEYGEIESTKVQGCPGE